MSSSTIQAALAAPGDGRDPVQVRKAAGDFEALLMASLLKTMREAGSSGWLGTGDDKASESLMEVAEQQMAQLMASQGGLGLARLVEQALSAPSGIPAATKPAAGR